MRCAACNAALDAARIARGETRCACGAELDLPGSHRPRESADAEVRVEPAPEAAYSYRSAPAVVATPGPELELASVGSELRCPRCETMLSYAFVGSYDVHECRRCFGAFVERAALATFTAEARTRGAAEVGVERLAGPSPDVPIDALTRCPTCRTMMIRTVFGRRSGVLVDVCTDHGTWFDAGELAKALAFEASGGAARVEQNERDEQAGRAQDGKVSRERALAEAALLREQVQGARAEGRWLGLFGERIGFLDFLRGHRRW